MISAQLGTEFEIPEYDKIKKVYSIWICMNAPKYIGNAISEYKLEKTDLIPGIPDRRKEYDKLSIVMVCLNTKKKQMISSLECCRRCSIAAAGKRRKIVWNKSMKFKWKTDLERS